MSDKVRLHLRLTPETYQLIGEYAKKNNCTTSNEFVERAVEFYVGYLSAEDCLHFLPPSLTYIFQRYILGASCKELVEHLREQDVPYDAGKLWNKNMVARILENRKYIGQPGWPLIIDTDTFEHANEKRSSKVSPPQLTDAQKVLRRLSGGSSAEVEQAVLHLLNLLIAEPQQIIAPQPIPSSPTRVSELWSNLGRELEQQPINEDAAKHLAMELASAQYEEIGGQEYETERLRRLFQRQAPMQRLDAEVLRNAVSRIYVHGKKVKIRLKNGQILERRA